MLAACATGGNGTAASSGGARDAAAPDSSSPPPAPSCMLGTPDDCGACGKKCPGPDDQTTVRTCSGTDATASCDILCRGEHYDLDGKVDNGCEAEDPIVQDSLASAVAITLPDVASDPMLKSNPLNVVAPLYGDARTHESPPTMRPLGREDWYKVTAVGTGTTDGTGMVACLSAANFPSDDELEVCITQNGMTTFDACKALVVAAGDAGGGSQCVYPGGMMNVDSGVFYVRVRRTKGSSNANEYALFLRH